MKLTAKQRKTRDKAFEAFEDAQADLENAIEEVNQAQADIYVRLEAARDAYADAVETLSEEIHSIGEELSEIIFGEKSEKWQDSDAGKQATELAESYNNFELNTFDVSECVEIEMPDNDLEQLLADLPDESEGA